VCVLPDAGPLITLAYAGALDLLLKPGWQVRIVDMVLHELTRRDTPTRNALQDWVARHALPVVATRTFARHQGSISGLEPLGRTSNLGELAIQEAMHQMALEEPTVVGLFLFEDHKIARSSFLVPDSCRKISTMAWLMFLERAGWIESAAAIERAAVVNGRAFSRIRFPPG
jgi:hypothetical protein